MEKEKKVAKYVDFTCTENKEGWLVEYYDSENECAKDIQIDYWVFLGYVRAVNEMKKNEAIVWIADPENIDKVNDLLAEYVSSKF